MMNPGMGQFGGYPYMMYPPGNKKVIINPTTKKPINYRTVPCKNFHSADGCSRGDNCHFIHDYAQAGKQIQNFQEWKNKNEVRQQNLRQMQNLTVGVATYYPPAGPEPHDPNAEEENRRQARREDY